MNEEGVMEPLPANSEATEVALKRQCQRYQRQIKEINEFARQEYVERCEYIYELEGMIRWLRRPWYIKLIDWFRGNNEQDIKAARRDSTGGEHSGDD